MPINLAVKPTNIIPDEINFQALSKRMSFLFSCLVKIELNNKDCDVDSFIDLIEKKIDL